MAGAVALLLVPAQARAQPGMLGVGYVANAPDALVGGTVWGLVPGLGGWGLYVDGKLNPNDRSSDGSFLEGLTPADVEERYPNDRELHTEEEWLSFNLAVIRRITSELMLYAGGGYAYRDVYRRYLDPAQSRGQFGHYWIKDEGDSAGTINVMGGALLRASKRLRLQFGGESAPVGFTVGASIALGGE
jgi:hypothetical protein